MGDPRRLKKKYTGPGHPWQKARIEEEAKLKKEFGYVRKKEIWKIQSMLRNFRGIARRLIGARGKEREREQLINRLIRLGLVEPGATLDDVLDLTIRDLSERRLQTIVYRKKMAASLKQARQLIVHKHIAVNGKVVTSPNYLVLKDDVVEYAKSSPLRNEEHPVRKQLLEPEKKTKVVKQDE
ncbi:MAG TPA: 30S ribosomal protein S4 [Candidatus Aenigmarchaeota archaeon]|nr:MAG: 30S ribosomal protein S4 [Nanoarchaeota archaeon]HDO79759.1 30S ribosomal protein S4 [Candidatus Aenigmarchaeota archaeon]HEX32811.1 30S ribosomal protein S4 [Candidatus Aenigmarchaeota archaeon]